MKSPLLLAALALSAAADTPFDAPGNFNPIVPGYFADPTIQKFGDTYYLYATTDGNGGGRGPATVWVSNDFVDWVLVPMNWPTTPHYWAPDVVKRPDGRYYLFYNQPCSTYAGVSSSPLGPWTPLTPGEGLVIPDRLVKDVITLDTQLFEDKDGTLYGHWGTWGIFPNSGCGWGVFNPDMKSFSRFGMIPNTQARDFFEAPVMIERNGVYYFTYSSGSCHDSSYRVQYATSDRPDGEFKMGPNNPILATNGDRTVDGPGHHSFLRAGDEWIIVYHRHDIPVTPNGMHRQTCADRMVFEKDGVIRKIEPTHRGIGPLAQRRKPANLAAGKPVSASSHYLDTLRKHQYKPEFAVDDNNATLWRPADNRAGHWLTVDLGKPQRVRRTETQFEYATWFYQYLVEGSLDGKSWTTFADRRANTRWGSPMTDDGDIEVRYLRLTVTGTELPGLLGAVWNFKAHADAPADPLLAMADDAFEKIIAPRQAEAGVRAVPLEAPAAGSPPALLIDLDVAALPLGAPVAAWPNKGKLGGEFRSGDAKPAVAMAAGCKAVRFAGRQFLTASFTGPRALAGNSGFTVAAWVNNPEIGESECFLSWAGRGGPDATTAQFNYGTHPEFGAVGHWGFADMGFRGEPPPAGQWHHLAVVFDGVIERLYINGVPANAEAKMLMMHAGRPVYVGASEPGSEFFDGYLASLRVYDGPLAESEIQQLATTAPTAEVLVHADAAKLDYGPLATWPNHGSLRGAFTPAGKPPEVADVDGRIAVRFAPGQALDLVADPAAKLADFSILLDITNPTREAAEAVLELVASDGTRHAVIPSPEAGTWQQVVLVFAGGKGSLFVNGVRSPLPVEAPPGEFKALRLGGTKPFSGALARVQLFGRALTGTEIEQLHALWQAERLPLPPPTAKFSLTPAALSPAMVAMRAEPGSSDLGPVEYQFTETTGQPGGSASGWTQNPFFLDDGLQPDTRYAYTVKTRDPLGNVTTASAPVEVVTDTKGFMRITDDATAARDLLGGGTAGTIWDGFLGRAEQSAPEAIAVRDGQIRLQSKGTVWDGGQPLGALLYKQVPGDFVVQVEVADYAGLADRRVPGNNDGGLMARVADVAAAGPGEDFVQLGFFPIWNQGNMVTSLDGGRSQKGNQLGWDAHRHLQVIRHGSLFHFRTSADGKTWSNLPGSPVERADLDGLPLQVGLYHASYGSESSYIAFRNFRLTTRK
jgi:hypothetical protein